MNSLLPTKTRAILTTALAAILPVFIPHAKGQTYTYSGTASNTTTAPDYWASGTNWSAVPTSNTSTVLNFSATLPYSTTAATIFTDNNVQNLFQLNALNFNYGSLNTAGGTVTIQDDSLDFVSNGATTPTLTLNATGPAGVIPLLAITSNVVLGSTLTISGASNATIGTLGSTTLGIVSGAGGLTMGGTGTLTLNGVNTYTGATTINSGFVTVSNANGLGVAYNATSAPNATVTVGSGGTLQLTNSIALNNKPLTISGTGATGAFGALEGAGGNSTYAGAVTLAGNTTFASDIFNSTVLNVNGTVALGSNTLTLNGPGSMFINGVISGTGGLTKLGTGSYTINNTETYTGTTNIAQGTLTLSGSVPTTNVLTFGATGAIGAGTLAYTKSSGTQTFGGTTLASIGSGINNTAGSTLNLGTITRNANSTINFGGSNVTTNTSGTTVTTTTNTTTTTTTVTGTTNISGLTNTNGIIGGYALVNSTGWAVAPSTSGGAVTALVPTGYTAASTAGNAAADNVDVLATTALATGTTDAFNSIRFNVNGSSILTLASGTTNIVTTGGILQTSLTGQNTQTITGGTLTSGTSELNIHDFSGTSALGLNIGSVISNNGTSAVGLTIDSTGGLVTLSALNTYTGPTVLSGRLNFATIGNVSGSSANALGIPASGNATIIIENTSSFVDNGTVAGSSDRPLSLVTPGSTVTIAAASTTTLTLSGGITGNNASVTLGGNTGTFTETGSISLGTGGLTKSNGFVATIGSATSTISYSGATTVNGGTLTINGTDNRTGTTTVSGSATLLLNGAPSSGTATAGAVSVTSGTLGGTGTLTGATTISSGAFITGGTKGAASGGTQTVVAASGTIGMLTLTNSLILSSGSTFQVDLSTTSTDKLAISGSLLSSGATINFVEDVTSGALAASGAPYVFATFTSDTGLSSYTFTNTPSGFSVVDTGSALELTPVPEPATFVLPGLLVGWLLLGAARRRKAQA